MRKLLATVILLAVTGSAVVAADCELMLRDAQTRVKANDYARAIALYKGVIDAKPGAQIEPRARLSLSRIMLKNKQPVADVIAQYEMVVKGFPKSPEAPAALLSIGYLHDRIGQEPAEWHTVVDKYPQSKQAAEALLRLGKLALRDGDTKRAIDMFGQSARMANADPKTAQQSRLEAGFAYIGQYWQTRDRSALQNAKAALRTSKNGSAALLSSASDREAESARVHMGMGEIYLIEGFGKEAAQEYQAVLDGSPGDTYTRGVARYELGCALYMKQDYEAAITAYDTFLAQTQGQTLREKDTSWKQQRPGYSSLFATDPEKASALSGLELVPDAAFWKASCLVELKRYNEARPILAELGGFGKLAIHRRVQNLRAVCTLLGGEGR